ncbi:uncharacterized protein LOC119835304 [Zerene cesonia]|uniref:uncharacterized protein LOC119835304 n=1 Tax=Zerene cesonia TaxID=33412 RepID=UPI0018E4FF12|nr:uncharacterized protein LOC119835304 [Zerene cesonia]
MNFPLEDSTTEDVPNLLKAIIEQLLSKKVEKDLMQKDVFFVLILTLMLENGFMPVKYEASSLDSSSDLDVNKLSQLKKESGIYKETFLLMGFHDVTVDVIMSPVGSTVIVNAIINDISSELYSVCLPLSRYVVSTQASTIPMMFRDLKHLSCLFKSKIVCPVKNSILNFCGYPSASLVGIPDDIFFSLMMFLNVQDILNVSKTCKRLNVLLENDSLWHALCKRDFKNFTESDPCDWRKIYVEAYKAEQEKKVPRFAGTIHDFMDISDMVSYIDNPLWGEII